ncbi:MAG TPA: hypothetical protein VK890_12540, partial [Bacteroidia bacterium]|nr:hypothetical protein [Bacteroidia bacterium]
PTWYPYEYWYPYPYWYDWGFYYGPYGSMVVFGFPSFYFTNWYFYHPRHWHRYPHLGSAYVHHYYGTHRSNTMSRQVVHNWVQNNRKYLPAGFTKNDAGRSETIKQLGLLNEKAINKQGEINTQARDQYFSKNTTQFSALNSKPEQPKVEEEKTSPNINESNTRPHAVNTQRVVQPATAKPQYNYNNLQNAQQYHSNNWQQAQPTYHPQQNQAPVRTYTPAARTYTPPARTYSPPARSGGGGRR